MANDGCQLPAWTGQAFAYLPHHPRANALASQSYAQQRSQGNLRGAVSELVVLFCLAHRQWHLEHRTPCRCSSCTDHARYRSRSSAAAGKPPRMLPGSLGLLSAAPASSSAHPMCGVQDRTGVWNGPAPVGSTGRTQVFGVGLKPSPLK